MSQGPPCKKNWSAGNKSDTLFHENVHFASILIILTTKLTTNKENLWQKGPLKDIPDIYFLCISIEELSWIYSQSKGVMTRGVQDNNSKEKKNNITLRKMILTL